MVPPVVTMRRVSIRALSAKRGRASGRRQAEGGPQRVQQRAVGSGSRGIAAQGLAHLRRTGGAHAAGAGMRREAGGIEVEAAIVQQAADALRGVGQQVLVGVQPDPRGIAVRMGEVLFDFDSAALRADTKKTLDAVIETLKRKYPDREIIVEGHTDSTGRKDYNQALSDKRAENVARYLSNGAGHDKFSYRGFASGKPIADNATEDGRKKNRRVEIIIKLN